MLCVACCDDDSLWLEQFVPQLSRCLQSRGEPFRIRTFSDGASLLAAISDADEPLDLLFLDIMLGRDDGLALGAQLRRVRPALPVVLVSMSPEFALSGYAVHPAHYLLKPIDRQKLFSVLDRAAGRLERDGKTLLLELPDELVRLPLYEVEYLEVRGNYVTVHGDGRAYTVKKALSALERELDDRFFRVGRSFVVNLSKVRRAAKREAVLESGSVIPLPRGGYEALNHAILRTL